ncbi:MAG TPA: hypothetical protein VGC13_23355 [Longimicrobium sp.]|jgi:hypothetical protein|uniref:hypothetical protein n=1 Tax=Longimicrobium sp. TaxID=2029185 RepID=UPI002ED7EDBA
MSTRHRPRRLPPGVLMLAGAWLAVQAACGPMPARVDQPLADADRVYVMVDGDTTPLGNKQITDPAAISRIRAYVEARPAGWARRWNSPPPWHVHATFYRGDKSVGWFAAGKNFLQAPSREGPEAMRDADPEELEELNRLLTVPPGSHRGPPPDHYPDHGP